MTITSKQAASFARSIVGAETAHDVTVSKAGATLAQAAAKAYAALGTVVTKDEFNLVLKPALVAAWTKAGRSEATIASQMSRVRSVVLGLAKGLKPKAGQTFKAFAVECGEALREGTNNAKRGPKARKTGGPTGPATGSPTGLSDGGSGKIAHSKVSLGDFQRACALVAGYAEHKASPSRAERIAFIFASADLSEQFDTYAATVKANDPK